MFSLMISHSTISGFNANGKNTTTATTHLQKARLIGGILSLRPRAMIKLPDQIAVAQMAKKYPKIICRFCSRFISLGISKIFHASFWANRFSISFEVFVIDKPPCPVQRKAEGSILPTAYKVLITSSKGMTGS